MKSIIKRLLAWRPDSRTKSVRNLLAQVRNASRPYTPDDEGDLIYRLIMEIGRGRCLETGFGTGSTAAYMLAAVRDLGEGSVTSVDFSEANFNQLGRDLIASSGMGNLHTLIEENSNLAIPRLFAEGREFDFVYLDGWKTFDHLTMELYFIARMLSVGGMIVFDDSYLSSVGRAITLLERYYGFKEVDYPRYGLGWRMRLWHAAIYRTTRRPYRAVVKTCALNEKPALADWTFDAPLH